MQIHVLVFLSVISSAAFAQAEFKMPTVCQTPAKLRAAFFEKQKLEIEKRLPAIRASEEKKKSFKDSDMYEWLRFTSPKTLGSLLDVADRNRCADSYAALIRANKTKEYESDLESWKNCLISDYRNAVPEMAERLLLCHGVAKAEIAPEYAAPINKDDENY